MGTTTYWEGGGEGPTDGTGRDDITDCNVCLPGWGPTLNQPNTCMQTLRGQYGPGGPINQANANTRTRISNCPSGSTTSLTLDPTSGTQNDDVSDCAFCLPGYCAGKDQSIGSPCKLAERGEWARGGAIGDEATTCQTCPTGTTTSTSGATDLSKCNWCLQGWGTTPNAPNTCTIAPNGYYAPGGPIDPYGSSTYIRSCRNGSTNMGGISNGCTTGTAGGAYSSTQCDCPP